MLRRAFLALSAVALLGFPALSMAAVTDVPAPGESKHIDEIKQRGTLCAGILGGYPWLRENTSGSGEQWDGPAWILLNEYANRLGVKVVLPPGAERARFELALDDLESKIRRRFQEILQAKKNAGQSMSPSAGTARWIGRRR